MHAPEDEFGAGAKVNIEMQDVGRDDKLCEDDFEG